MKKSNFFRFFAERRIEKVHFSVSHRWVGAADRNRRTVPEDATGNGTRKGTETGTGTESEIGNVIEENDLEIGREKGNEDGTRTIGMFEDVTLGPEVGLDRKNEGVSQLFLPDQWSLPPI